MEIVQRCDFHIGETIDGKFTVKKLLGEGSFGKVFMVTEKGTTYALKLLKLWEIPSDVRKPLMDRFDMEFQTGQIDSPYLVHSLRHGMVQGNPYILMEFCPGGDMGSKMEEWHLASDSDSICAACHDVLSGLAALHKNGKVHRDLKPENVLFKADGTAALTDFGISGDRNKRLTERNILGRPQQIFGTYAYMPPEQVSRARGDATVLPTTDIFSFGVMLFQLLSGGELPFGPLNDQNDLVRYQMNGKAGKWNRDIIRSACSTSGTNWLRILEGCLEPDFKNRTQSADSILHYFPAGHGGRHAPVFVKEEPPMRHTGRIQLKVMQGEEFGRIYRLTELLEGGNSVITMGRGTGNKVHLLEQQSCYVSRNHCTLEYDVDDRQWFIRDGQWKGNEGWCPSTNGTYVNSKQVSESGYFFQEGDIISVGDMKLRVESY